MTESLICDHCHGIINPGEPVARYQGGAITHYFKHTCEHVIEDEEKFIKKVGLKLE